MADFEVVEGQPVQTLVVTDKSTAPTAGASFQQKLEQIMGMPAHKVVDGKHFHFNLSHLILPGLDDTHQAAANATSAKAADAIVSRISQVLGSDAEVQLLDPTKLVDLESAKPVAAIEAPKS